ncbi:MAG: hypothetical protein HYR64_01655 [Fimbriimonas ginsengisoli]|uniref:Uncharacterized protein n=1 Tax=Fimbriimonas ginsengisoli TaxID=1005039 RepID=A0A931LU88_FIMGI|nr:hypothetical protein [Fimbriimonas ginsengisoli]
MKKTFLLISVTALAVLIMLEAMNFWTGSSSPESLLVEMALWMAAIACLTYVASNASPWVARVFAVGLFCLAATAWRLAAPWHRTAPSIGLVLAALAFWTLLPRPFWRK